MEPRIFKNREMLLPSFFGPSNTFGPSTDETHQSVAGPEPVVMSPNNASTQTESQGQETSQNRVYEINGQDFSTLEQFYETISNVLIPGASWGHNLDAFNDILRGGFGTPEEGFTIVWRNSQTSKQRLGYKETIRQLQMRLLKCHSSNVPVVRDRIAMAEQEHGDTVFDWLVEIIREHCAGGPEDNGVILILD